jgi:hypothetical protein
MKFIIILLLISITSCVSAQKKSNSQTDSNKPTTNKSEQILEVKLCDFFNSPEKFVDKPVKIKTIYRYGFESTEFYSLNCSAEKRVWVETTEKKCSESDEVDKMDFAGQGGRTFGVVARGTFFNEGKKYGHLNNYDFLFKIDCLERAKFIDDKGYVPQALSDEQKTKIKQFEEN